MKNQKLVSGPRSRFPGETLLAFQHDPAGYLEQLAHAYGDLVHLYLGPIDTFFVNHPDLIKQVLVTQNRNFRLGYAHQRVRHFFGDGLVTSEGASHLRQRRLMEPMFHQRRIAGSADTAVDYAAQWCAERHHGESIDLGQEMWALTLNIITKTLFNTSVKDEIEEISQAVYAATSLFSPMMMLFADWLLKFHIPPAQRFERSLARLDKTMHRIINEHRKRGDQGDLLSMLLQAHATPDETQDDTNVRDQLLTFFIAGHGTTAVALTWTFYLLSQNPAAHAHLVQELDNVLGGRLPTLADLGNLLYARNVLQEAMRMYPPVWGMDREVVNECEIGGQTFPKGALVLISQWVTHHDARFYSEPYRFEPERWARAAQPPPYAYFPFSAGPRVCIGEEMTWMNGVLLLATIVQRWRMCLEPGQKITPGAGTSLAPKTAIHMRLAERV